MIFYAYIYSDSTGPFYIGKGSGKRFANHIDLLLNKPAVDVRILPANDESEAFELEKFLISLIGRKDLNAGPLLNVSDGGLGSMKRKFSDATIKKLSESRKALFASGYVNPQKGKKRPDVSARNQIVKPWGNQNARRTQ